MCECGCGEAMAPVVRFAGPEGFVYALGLYPGCRECDTPAGITFYRIPQAVVDDDGGPFIGIEDAVEAPFFKFGEWEEFSIPVIDREGLLTAMHEQIGSTEDYDADGALHDAAPGFIKAASRHFFDFLNRVRGVDGPAERSR